MGNAILEANKLGQSVWLDNIRRGMLRSGELERLVSLGVSGITSNPTIFEKAILGSSDYDDALLRCAGEGMGPEETYEALAIEDLRAAADLLRTHYDRTAGADGYVSLEVNPHLAHDTEATIGEANRLFEALDRPNVMVKVPATPQGVPAVHNLIGKRRQHQRHPALLVGRLQGRAPRIHRRSGGPCMVGRRPRRDRVGSLLFRQPGGHRGRYPD